MIIIDGSEGEGGGQILRSSLALSILSGRPVRIENVRARRSKPGLRPQHLAAVRAAAVVGGGTLSGDAISSMTLEFRPGVQDVHRREFQFDIGTAGSAALVLQTVLPPLLFGRGAGPPFRVDIRGGTHNPLAPSFDFLERSFLPLLNTIAGGRDGTVGIELGRHGFYPAGGGRLRARIAPCDNHISQEVSKFALVERGPLRGRRATVLSSRLPTHVAEREAGTIAKAWQEFGAGPEHVVVRHLKDCAGPGNVVLLDVEYARVTEVFAVIGEKGRPAEAVAAAAVKEAQDYEHGAGAVGEHLADQLLLPLALCGGGRFTTTELSLHTRTNADVIAKFLDCTIRFEHQSDGAWSVEVSEASIVP